LDTLKDNVGSTSPDVVLKSINLAPSKTSVGIIFKSSGKKI